jgi:integrase
MINIVLNYIKKKDIIHKGSALIRGIKDKELRILAILLFTSGLSIEEIKNIKWEDIAILENILLFNENKKTRIAIASDSFKKEINNLNYKKDFILPNLKKLDETLIKKKINNLMYINSIYLGCSPITSDWFENNFSNTIFIPRHCKEHFNNFIISKNTLDSREKIKEKEFLKILDIKSIL